MSNTELCPLCSKHQTTTAYISRNGATKVCTECFDHINSGCTNEDCTICPDDSGMSLEEALAWAKDLGMQVEYKENNGE